jgi:hypothetical protein
MSGLRIDSSGVWSCRTDRPSTSLSTSAIRCGVTASPASSNALPGMPAPTPPARAAERPPHRAVHRWRPVPEWIAQSFVAAIVSAEQAMGVNLECVSVPAAGFGRRRVGAVQKPRKRLVGVARGSYRLIGQQELLVLVAVVSSIGFYAVFREACGSGYAYE